MGVGGKSLAWIWGEARAGTVAWWAFAKVPAQRPSRQLHPNGMWEAFPGVVGGMQGFQPSLVSWEAGGWAVVSPGRLGAGFQPQLVCPSVRKNLTSQKVSVPSWHWSCGLPRARGWWCQAKEREGGVDLPYNKCSLEETGRMSPQPMDEETEARDREITCSGHFMGGDDGTAGWIRVWP